MTTKIQYRNGMERITNPLNLVDEDAIMSVTMFTDEDYKVHSMLVLDTGIGVVPTEDDYISITVATIPDSKGINPHQSWVRLFGKLKTKLTEEYERTPLYEFFESLERKTGVVINYMETTVNHLKGI